MTEEELRGFWTNWVRPILNGALIATVAPIVTPVVGAAITTATGALGKRSGNFNYYKHIYYDIL